MNEPIIYQIKGEPTPTPTKTRTVELEYGDNGKVCLRVDGFYVLELLPDGTMRRVGCVGEETGLQVDSLGRVKLAEDW